MAERVIELGVRPFACRSPVVIFSVPKEVLVIHFHSMDTLTLMSQPKQYERGVCGEINRSSGLTISTAAKVDCGVSVILTVW